MKARRGDLIVRALAGEFDVIVHGCNCFCTMGAGIAKTVRRVFPSAFEADKATAAGDRDKLGTCSVASCETTAGAPLVVVNAYTQFQWRGRGPHIDYDAVRSCLRWVAAAYPDSRIGLPRIGAGLAGGDWARIEGILADEFDGLDCTVVEFVRA